MTIDLGDDNYATLVGLHVARVAVGQRVYQFRIRSGFRFDGASIPRFLWRLCGHPLEMPRAKAALVHDWLYASHAVERKTADQIYRELSRKYGLSWLRTQVEYLALRRFGKAAWCSHGVEDHDYAVGHGTIREREVI